MTLTAKSLGLSSVILSGSAVLGPSYVNSQEDFSKYIKNECLSKKAKEEDWKTAQEKLINSSNEIFSKSFKDLKTKLEGISKTSVSDAKKESGGYLKDLCIESYSQTYKSWLFKNDSLLSDLKSFCSLKIKDKLQKEKIFDTSGNNDQQVIKQKVKELQSHSQETEGANLDETLRSIKNEDQDWEKLKDWCKNTYEKPYLDEESDNYLKLSKKYCQK